MQVIHDRHLLYIASREIEQTVADQDLWVPRRHEAAEANHLRQFGSGLSLVGAYYELCFANQATPSQREYVDFYLNAHENNLPELSSAQITGMRARAARAYNSFVAEHQLLSLCIESGKFDACYKSEVLDLQSMLDLVVKLGPNHFGFAIQIPTEWAKHWIPIKLERQKARGIIPRWPLEVIWMNFERMKSVSNIHLFCSFYGVNVVLEKISQMRFDMPSAKNSQVNKETK